MGRKKKLEMEIINPHAAGIDIGSKSHFVAVGQALEDVEEFGVYAQDLEAICFHLKEYGITTVAMESTGDYWQNLFTELVKHDFDVVLCNGKFTKHAKGRKPMLKMPGGFKSYIRWGFLPVAFFRMKLQKSLELTAAREQI